MEPFHTFRSGKLNRNVGERNSTKNEYVVYSVPENRKQIFSFCTLSLQSNFHLQINLSNFQVFSEKYFVLTLLIPDFYQFTLAALVEVGSQENWKHQTIELH
jgi:hypothetical protein